MTEQTPTHKHRHHLWLDFLGSMNLAITILVVLAIASVIGTVLQQNQPYQDYIIKFGPFWHEIFKALDLYDVYGALWFLVLLGFLLLSTSVCVYRNGPVMLRDMQHYRLNMQEKSLRVLRNFREWNLASADSVLESSITRYMQSKGYRVRRKLQGDTTLLAYMKGGMNRMGYILTHVGIVVICIGGLLDGNFVLTVKQWLGQIELEKRDISVDKVPDKSRLKPQDAISFRGAVSLPEGTAANFVFLNVEDGYLIQELPFAVELKDFRIEHYASGQPKSFESDLIIHDDQLDEPLEKTIAVNHPLIYRGYAIYQASFGDGGTQLKLQARPLFDAAPKPLAFTGEVHGQRKLETEQGGFTLEFNDFKNFNVFPATEPEHKDKKFVNFGASMTYKLRDASGVAREYTNFMSPVLQEGRYFFLSGMRTSNAEDFRYLHIPADENMSQQRFLNFHAYINDIARLRKIAERNAQHALGMAKIKNDKMFNDIVTSMLNLASEFNRGGYAAIDKQIRATVPAEKQQQVAEAYIKILENVLRGVYLQVMQDEGIDTSKGLNDMQAQFYDDAIVALSGLGAYGSPFYLQMIDFELRESSGLQITRAPGKNVVYFGCVMLIVGIFLMFYIAHQRVWLMLSKEASGVKILFAGTGNRNQRDFAVTFSQLVDDMDRFFKRQSS